MYIFERSSFPIALLRHPRTAGIVLRQVCLSVAMLSFVTGCDDGPVAGDGDGLALGESCETSTQCGDDLACIENDAGDAVCSCADNRLHDGGDGTCVSRDQCVAGYHDGGDRTCRPEGECAEGISLIDGQCALAAAPVCLQYIECVAHFDDINGSTTSGTEAVYGNGGDCWEDEETAEACREACSSAVEALFDSLDATGDPTGPCE